MPGNYPESNQPRQWVQLHLYTGAEHSERLETALFDAGAMTLTLQDDADQPVLEPGVGETPLWDSLHISALFNPDCDRAALLQLISDTCPEVSFRHHFELLADADWERACLDRFQPMRFGQRLWICPSWCSPPDPGGITLSLDPGLAFGTGSHPTTALCLEWLDANNVNDRLVIDYGCGSGILAIAALLLGARQAIAIDNDPQALLATRQNAAENGVPASSLVTCDPQQATAHLATVTRQTMAGQGAEPPIVIANILAGILVDLAPVIKPILGSGATLVLSGILEEQVEIVQQAYQDIVDFQPVVLRDGWARLVGNCQAKKRKQAMKPVSNPA